jgi:hypothetical protein
VSEIAAHAENMRLLRLIREDPAWALSRVKRATELEAEVERLRGVRLDLEARLAEVARLAVSRERAQS